jgi:hypothetical protein
MLLVSESVPFISQVTFPGSAQPLVSTEHAIRLLRGFWGLVASSISVHILLHRITTKGYASRVNITFSGGPVKVGKV